MQEKDNLSSLLVMSAGCLFIANKAERDCVCFHVFFFRAKQTSSRCRSHPAAQDSRVTMSESSFDKGDMRSRKQNIELWKPERYPGEDRTYSSPLTHSLTHIHSLTLTQSLTHSHTRATCKSNLPSSLDVMVLLVGGEEEGNKLFILRLSSFFSSAEKISCRCERPEITF